MTKSLDSATGAAAAVVPPLPPLLSIRILAKFSLAVAVPALLPVP